MKNRNKKYRSGEKGQTITESLLCFIVLCLILVGFLEIFNIVVAKMLTEYASYRAGRSYAVGFPDFLLTRSARVAAIGASGTMVSPDNQTFSSPMDQFGSEQVMIPEYLQGNRWLEYEYWLGENEYDSNYYNPSVQPPSTYLTESYTETGAGTVQMSVAFSDYPFKLFDLIDKDRVWFQPAGRSRDVKGEAELANHAQDYLQ